MTGIHRYGQRQLSLDLGLGVLLLAAGLLMFVKPVQAAVMTPLLGARRPTTAEADVIEPLWADVAQANGLTADRYILRILPSDELNAYACGGHLVVVTSYAVDELTTRQLRGVLAHELSHHLGLHTVAITIGPSFVLLNGQNPRSTISRCSTIQFASKNAALWKSHPAKF